MINKIKAHKKLIIVIAIAIAAFVTIMAVVLKNLGDQSGDGITRYQWIDMLAEQFGMQEYQNEEPYYKDVPTDSEYFAAIQSAKEWGVTDETPTFDGEKKINGEYAALTAMKAIGKYKVMIYLGLDNEPTEKQYLDLAKETGLITEAQLRKSITEEESTAILDRAEELFLHDLWVDDLAEATYREDVVKLTAQDIQSEDSENGVLQLTTDALAKISEGQKIVYPDSERILTTGKVTEIRNNGYIKIEGIDYTEVTESVLISDLTTITLDDILEANGIDRSEGKPYQGDLTLTSDEPKGENQLLHTQNVPVIQSEGFSVAVKWNIDTGVPDVHFIEENNGLEYVLPTKEGVYSEGNGNYVEAVISLKDINIGAQVVSNSFIANYSDPDYLNLQCNARAEVVEKAAFHMEKSIPIPLGIAPINIKCGEKNGEYILALEAGLFLDLEADGSVQLKVSAPTAVTVVYEKGIGYRAPSFTLGEPEKEVKADCKLAAFLDLKLHLEIFRVNLIEIKLGLIGAIVKAEFITRTKSDIDKCIDVHAYLPVFRISIVSDLQRTPGKALLDIQDPDDDHLDNALVSLGFHAEHHREGYTDFPEKCTYKEEEAKENNEGNLLPGVYIMEVHEDPITAKGKCEVTGNLYIYDAIPQETLEELRTGDIYELYDHEFTYEGMGKKSELPGQGYIQGYIPPELDEDIYKFHDQNDNIYYVIKESYTPYGNAYNEMAELNRMEDRIEPIRLYVYYQESDGNTSSSGATNPQCMTLAKEDYRIVLDDMTGIGAKALELTDDNYITFEYFPSVSVAYPEGYGSKEAAEKPAIDISLGWVDGRHYEFDDIKATWQ